MTSTYGYSTLAKLEKEAHIDYSTLDSALSDTEMDNFISQAEMDIISYLDYIHTGTIPVQIEHVTNDIAKMHVRNWLREHKIGQWAQETEMETIFDNIDIIAKLDDLKSQLDNHQSVWISKRNNLGGQIYYPSYRGW